MHPPRRVEVKCGSRSSPHQCSGKHLLPRSLISNQQFRRRASHKPQVREHGISVLLQPLPGRPAPGAPTAPPPPRRGRRLLSRAGQPQLQAPAPGPPSLCVGAASVSDRLLLVRTGSVDLLTSPALVAALPVRQNLAVASGAARRARQCAAPIEESVSPQGRSA
ncbi:hypothetical protein NDU88_005224 [Pleurodeles waltl]|uniref:Uncharacterized protein n=1 Tax=Pleurodeles waltl TaxID=8319 RepID=A0AAV7M9C2_PLEWA|nr:hypothetical protein NDU88_005224 [Pleurodeles waltl]